jgi:beta-glucosidase
MTQVHTNTSQDISQSIDERVQALLNQMTLAEKIGQMTQVEKNSITPQEVTKYFIGSVLSGGGGNPTPNTPQSWRDMVVSYMQASLKTRLAIPLIYGVDAVHGHNNVVGATIFPHNIGLGATRDTDLVKRIGTATASEVLATNVHWDFAPAVSVPRDFRWGRTYEGYSEDTSLVSEMGAAYVRGLQQPLDNGEWVLASVKHYVADGGTTWDSRKDAIHTASGASNWQAANEDWRIDQGDSRMDEATLRRIHLEPYKHAIEAGAENIMVSFSSWNGLKMHAHEYLLNQVLKIEMGFEGFLVSDWMALSHLAAKEYDTVVIGINAGLDMIMVPFEYKSFIKHLTKAVKNGDVPMSRIDDAVERILRVKFLLGLFENPITDESHMANLGSEAHRELAREAVRKSLVLLKNDDHALPLQPNKSIAIAGKAADDVGLACGGWTIEWQGSAGAITKGKTLVDGLRTKGDITYRPSADFEAHFETGIVVIAEIPYAEGMGDNPDLTISDDDLALIRKMRPQCDHLILVMYSGRPIIISEIADECDAIVAAFLPGSEANAIADVLTGEYDFTGKLSFRWIADMAQLPITDNNAESAQWQFGHGLNYRA